MNLSDKIEEIIKYEIWIKNNDPYMSPSLEGIEETVKEIMKAIKEVQINEGL